MCGEQGSASAELTQRRIQSGSWWGSVCDHTIIMPSSRCSQDDISVALRITMVLKWCLVKSLIMIRVCDPASWAWGHHTEQMKDSDSLQSSWSCEDRDTVLWWQCYLSWPCWTAGYWSSGGWRWGCGWGDQDTRLSWTRGCWRSLCSPPGSWSCSELVSRLATWDVRVSDVWEESCNTLQSRCCPPNYPASRHCPRWGPWAPPCWRGSGLGWWWSDRLACRPPRTWRWCSGPGTRSTAASWQPQGPQCPASPCRCQPPCPCLSLLITEPGAGLTSQSVAVWMSRCSQLTDVTTLCTLHRVFTKCPK